MKNLSTLLLACTLLIFVSCTKEEIIPTEKDIDNGALIINTDENMLEAEYTVGEENFDNDNSNNNNSTNVTIKSTIGYLASESDLSTFHAAIVKTGMDATLSWNGPYTIFAPNNKAFHKFLQINNWNSLDDVPTGVLTNIVKFHITISDVTINNLIMDHSIPTLFNNQPIHIHTSSSPAQITMGLTGADVIMNDIEVSNGNINKINAVLSL